MPLVDRAETRCVRRLLGRHFGIVDLDRFRNVRAMSAYPPIVLQNDFGPRSEEPFM